MLYTGHSTAFLLGFGVTYTATVTVEADFFSCDRASSIATPGYTFTEKMFKIKLAIYNWLLGYNLKL